jgi:hypothetical protein
VLINVIGLHSPLDIDGFVDKVATEAQKRNESMDYTAMQ